MELHVNIIPCETGKGRKRLVQKENWKRIRMKEMRHKPKDLPEFPTCNHAKKVYCCQELRTRDVQQFHSNLYSTKDKVKQDIFILKYCEGEKPKRSSTNLHGISIKYFIPTVGGGKLRVCKKAFLGVTHLSSERIERIVRKFVVKGEMPKERRGGDTTRGKFEPTKLSIKRFIESLKCAESHYNSVMNH